MYLFNFLKFIAFKINKTADKIPANRIKDINLKGYLSSRLTVSGEKAGTQTAIYSAPPSKGEEY